MGLVDGRMSVPESSSSESESSSDAPLGSREGCERSSLVSLLPSKEAG